MILNIVLLVLGFILLVKGADFFVDGSSSVARLLRIPSFIVGLTIVAFGTSAPELSVSISAAMQGQNEIAISNVLGSNIFNLMVVTGVCAVISFVPVADNMRKHDFPLSIFAAILLLIFGLLGGEVLGISRYEGLILLALFIIYIALQIRSALKSRADSEPDPIEKFISPGRSILLIIVGCVMIVYGGDFVVDSASAIAQAFGLTETLIGLTIVAIGTSLPELVTSIVASRKHENDLAIGNVIGSNVFNILMILGLSTSLNPVPLQTTAIFDCAVLIIFSIIVLIFCFTRSSISRREGIIMLGLYAIYDVYIILR